MVKKMKRREGFTLIEVVTTLFIIGLLTLLILPNLYRIRDIADQRQAKAMEQTIRSQVELFRLEYPNNPPNLDKLISGRYLNEQQVDRMHHLGINISKDGEVSRSSSR
ncbi:prepilin-type N-terminal cleavage/methylation domain-containing protein [Weissella kandleri]|uniref:prepilin-type N-terminal cleavage/methylation domain-containing protein n=1 Tax=Weissella kandleri TaxID=1616 RepID=UPI00387E5050